MTTPELAAPSVHDRDDRLISQVGRELRSYFRWPLVVPTIVCINVALALGAWFIVDPHMGKKYTALAFLPIAIVSWAFADVPATNLYGSTPEQVINSIDNPRQLRRLMTVKNISLWLLIAPGTCLLSLALLPSQNQPVLSLAICVAVLVIPFTYLGLASMMAPLLPFHELPWRTRLERRDTWLRYGAAIFIAYLVLTWPAAILAVLPAIVVILFIGDQPEHFLLGALLITPWALFLWRVGLHLATRIADRRREWLVEFLSDPSRG